MEGAGAPHFIRPFLYENFFLPVQCSAIMAYTVAVCVHLYVHLFVTTRCSIKTAKNTITQTVLKDSQRFDEIPMSSLLFVAPNAGRVGKNCVFDRSRLHWLRCYTAKIFSPSATMVRISDSAGRATFSVVSNF